MSFALQIIGLLLFLLPGVLLSYILFSRTDIIKRIVYTLTLSVSILIISKVFLSILQVSSIWWGALFWVLLNVLLIFALIRKKGYKTYGNRDIWYLLLFSLAGALWRIRFLVSTKNFGDAYTYSSIFPRGEIPDLGFYTGMAIDHSNYVWNASNSFFELLNLNQTVSIFLITFLYLGFIYLIFKKYTNTKMAYIGVALMALGPIEIFHSTLGLVGQPLSYIALFSLFLLFTSEKEDVQRIFFVTVLISIAMSFIYYTATVVIILASAGFIISLAAKELIVTRKLGATLKNSFKNRKILAFILVLFITLLSLFMLTEMGKYSVQKAKDATVQSIEKDSFLQKAGINEYKDPAFLGISAIRWQSLFFFLSGMTLIIYLIIKRDILENVDLFVSLIPVAIVSFGFYYVNMPARIFDYFAFFGLLSLKIPKKYLKVFFVLSLIFILITSFQIFEDKKIFFENSDGEIESAEWIKDNLQGRLFSDQSFLNHVIQKGYYNVTGISDKDPRVQQFFYQHNHSVLLNATNKLDVDYIAITKRMSEKYILMLDLAQKPLINNELYENNLEKIYDNSDVRIYKAKNESS